MACLLICVFITWINADLSTGLSETYFSYISFTIHIYENDFEIKTYKISAILFRFNVYHYTY